MKTTFLFSGFAVCLLLALFVGCKKEAPAAPEPVTNAVNATPPARIPAAQPPPAQASIAQDYDATLFMRSLEFVKGRIAAKDYQAARDSLKPLEAQQLTPAQRQMLESVKAQIPRN